MKEKDRSWKRILADAKLFVIGLAVGLVLHFFGVGAFVAALVGALLGLLTAYID